MTLPSLALGFVCALLLGSLFHLLMDGGPGRLVLYMVFSIAGFAGGSWLAQSQGWVFLPLGPIQMGPAVAGSLLVMLVGHWLSSVRVQSVDHSDTV